jgi:hypothetical protein
MLAQNGANILRIIARATYDVPRSGELRLAAKQAPIRFKDVYWGEDGVSSLRYESDISLEKQFVDLIVNGEACAPHGRPAPWVDVGVLFENRIVKRMRVFGDRRWHYGLAGWKSTAPEPFVNMPVIYDRAFGGLDPGGSEPRNRVGTGYASRVEASFAGTPLPNVEAIDALVGSPSDRPPPVGTGVISRDWLPRVAFAGTYDQAWLDERMPLLPDDFDARFNQSVPEDQWLRNVVGGESLQVVGMASEGALGFRIPRGSVRLRAHFRKRTDDVTMPLDTILVDCQRRQLELTWRSSVDIHGDPFQLRAIVVTTDSAELLAPSSALEGKPTS